MNRLIKNIPFKDYLITIITTMVICAGLAFFVELDLLFKCQEKINFEELNMENLSKFCTIEQLEKYIQDNPKSASAHIKIANIYESLNENAKANTYYNKALILSQRSNFALYSYAIFAAKNNLLNIATTLAEEITANNSKTYQYRANIYEAIADTLTKNEYYEGANKAYEIAYKYAKNVDNKNYLKKIQEKYATSYVYTADEWIKEKNVEAGIIDLNNSIKIYPTPLAKYKLGLIYKDTNPKMAERLISKVMKENPYLVNPYIYNNLLKKLYDDANARSNDNDINYYSMQQRKFDKKLKEAYLYKDEISITNSKIITKKVPRSAKKDVLLKFNVKNNTDFVIKNLYVNAKLFYSEKTAGAEKKVISGINPLQSFEEAEDLQLELSDIFSNDDIKNHTDFYVRYYAKKAQNAPWTLISIVKLNI